MRTEPSSHDTEVWSCTLYTHAAVWTLGGTEHGDFGAELQEVFASFQRKRKKGLKYELSLQLKKEKKNQPQKNRQ